MQNKELSQHLFSQGFSALQQNQAALAKQAFEQALDADQDCLEAHLVLAELRFPGEPYLDVLSRIHRELRPRTYVEIGVADGASMARALPETRCIGIDPEPTLGAMTSPTAEIYMMTSDAFFAENNLTELLDGLPLDLGFIDGLHLFENALEDFINLERFCTRSSTLLIHDCLPLNPLTAARERQTRFWTGDVWRVIPILKRFRPDLSISMIGTQPSGLAVIRNLDPASTVLAKKREDAVAYGAGLDFNVANSFAALGVEMVPADWSAAAHLFARAS